MLDLLDQRIEAAKAAQLRAVMAGRGWAKDGWAINFWRVTYRALERQRQSEVQIDKYNRRSGLDLL